MSKPWIHAVSSARKHGGETHEYLAIHEFLDSSKSTIADVRHRALTHTAWFISFILPKVFGDVFTNSVGKVVSVRDIGEQHVLEDFGHAFIPSVQDFLENLPMEDWMNQGHGKPPASCRKLVEKAGGSKPKFAIVD